MTFLLPILGLVIALGLTLEAIDLRMNGARR